MNQLRFFLTLMAPFAVSESSEASPSSAPVDIITWHVVQQWGVEGRGWTDVKRPYDRLPARAEGMVRDQVWELSRHSAGISCRFATDASEIRVRYNLLHPALAMPHMPATGVSGVDLYALTGEGEWRWLGTVQPTSRRVSATIISGLPPGRRTYQLNLPLYNGIDSLEIGVAASAVFEPIAPRREKPLVFYGTSIMQGGCVSRPGMAIPAILGRRLNIPVINLGFSGNGKMEPEVGKLLSELEAAVFVLDCLPNLTVEETAERTEPLVRLLRKARPAAPIVLVEDRVFSNAPFLPELMKEHRKRHAALREAYDRLVASGIGGLHYLGGADLLGHDGDGTVDGSHPSDLGMERYADAYEKFLRPLLQPK